MPRTEDFNFHRWASFYPVPETKGHGAVRAVRRLAVLTAGSATEAAGIREWLPVATQFPKPTSLK